MKIFALDIETQLSEKIAELTNLQKVSSNRSKIFMKRIKLKNVAGIKPRFHPLILEQKMESGRLAHDAGLIRLGLSTRSTNKVQLGVPQTESTSVFCPALNLSIFLSRSIYCVAFVVALMFASNLKAAEQEAVLAQYEFWDDGNASEVVDGLQVFPVRFAGEGVSEPSSEVSPSYGKPVLRISSGLSYMEGAAESRRYFEVTMRNIGDRIFGVSNLEIELSRGGESSRGLILFSSYDGFTSPVLPSDGGVRLEAIRPDLEMKKYEIFAPLDKSNPELTIRLVPFDEGATGGTIEISSIKVNGLSK